MRFLRQFLTILRSAAPLLRMVACLIVLGGLLAACASRPGPETLNARPASIPGAKVVTIYVATSRTRIVEAGERYSDLPSETLNFAEYKISIPPSHKSGEIEYPDAHPDPKTQFTVVAERSLDRAAFLKGISRTASGKTGDISIFVHGFNTNLPEAIFRRAQLTADMGVADDEVSVLFSWPSTGSISGYLADKAGATASRDQLTELLTMVVRQRPTGEIALIGHSMGGWLVGEALRQLKLVGRQEVLDRLKVVLAAPDIDGLVFIAQMDVIGRMRQPMTILVSKRDLALSFSSFISQDPLRIGQLDIHDPRVQEGAKQTNIQIIDISDVKSEDSFHHNGFVSLAVYYPELRKQEAKGQLLSGKGGVYVFDAVAQTLIAPFRLATRAAAKQ
jgi:esterase/lipase superfamily enzyme